MIGNPRSEDTQVLLPALAEQVVSAEQERDASGLALSTLHFHTDKADPKPILARSWKSAEGRQRCPHARPSVIVLGDGQGTFVALSADAGLRSIQPESTRPSRRSCSCSGGRPRHRSSPGPRWGTGSASTGSP